VGRFAQRDSPRALRDRIRGGRAGERLCGGGGVAAGGWGRAGVAAYGSRRACGAGGRFARRDSPRALREGIHGGRGCNCLAGAVYRIVFISTKLKEGLSYIDVRQNVMLSVMITWFRREFNFNSSDNTILPL
jgi:hypothetical protein